MDLLRSVPLLADGHHNHRLWKHHASNILGESGYHFLCHHWNAVVSVVFIEYRWVELAFSTLPKRPNLEIIFPSRRHPCKVLQMDLRQSLSVSNMPGSFQTSSIEETSENYSWNDVSRWDSRKWTGYQCTKRKSTCFSLVRKTVIRTIRARVNHPYRRFLKVIRKALKNLRWMLRMTQAPWPFQSPFVWWLWLVTLFSVRWSSEGGRDGRN